MFSVFSVASNDNTTELFNQTEFEEENPWSDRFKASAYMVVLYEVRK